MRTAARRSIRLRIGKEQIVVGDVRDAYDQNAHPASRSMDDSGGDVDQRSLAHGLRNTVEQDCPLSVEDVIQLCRATVIMLASAVDIHGMGPGGNARILAADQPVPPAAGASLAGDLAFVSDEGLELFCDHRCLRSCDPATTSQTTASCKHHRTRVCQPGAERHFRAIAGS